MTTKAIFFKNHAKAQSREGAKKLSVFATLREKRRLQIAGKLKSF
jgi:hypothetical protein